jgi:hypothetical protein
MNNNYAPHTLLAKVDLMDIPKGSLLHYVFDIDNEVTYRAGARSFILSADDASNSEYFTVTTTPPVALPVTPAILAAPATPATPAAPEGSIFARFCQQNPKLVITIAVFALLFIGLDFGGVFKDSHVQGAIAFGVVIDISWMIGLSLLVRKVGRQLSQGEAWFAAIGFFFALYVPCLAVIVAFSAPGEPLGPIHPSVFEIACIFAAERLLHTK